MTQELISSHQIITEKLRKFWGTLSDNQRKEVGMRVAFIVSTQGSSQNLMGIIQQTIGGEIPGNIEFDAVMDTYSTLDSSTQGVVRRELGEYFLNRNS